MLFGLRIRCSDVAQKRTLRVGQMQNTNQLTDYKRLIESSSLNTIYEIIFERLIRLLLL